MLSVENVSIRAGNFRLDNVSFSVDANEHVVLLGESGAGKSLLLRALAGLHPIAAGTVIRDGASLTALATHERRLPLLHQRPVLFRDRNVRANLAFAIRHRDHPSPTPTLESVIERTGIGGLMDRRPGSLSGGEAQRVALARAMLTGADTLLLDEPLSALDVGARAAMHGVLLTLRQDAASFLHVTHDYEEALSLATHIGVIGGGTLQQFGSRDDILSDPRSPFLARFSGIRNVIPGTLGSGDVNRVREFAASAWRASVLTETESGEGFLLLRAEDVTLAQSQIEDSARNHFRGTVVDVVPAVLGQEVIVDVGVPLVAHISHEAAEGLHPAKGDEIFAGFKATAARFIRSHIRTHD